MNGARFSLKEIIAKQARHPRGMLGRFIFWVMQRETASENLAAVDLLDLQARDQALEIGFGHGRNLRHLMQRVSDGLVAGVDPSALMVERANRRFQGNIVAGRMLLREGSTANLPFDTATFDKALAVHVAYFWENPSVDLTELRRVLRPGGRLVLVFRDGDDAKATGRFPEAIYHLRSTAEWERLIVAANFTTVSTVSRSLGSRTIVFLTASA